MTFYPDTRDPSEEPAAVADLFRPRNREESRGRACPPTELLRAYRADTLSPVLHDHVARHVERCAMCQMLAEPLAEASADFTADENDRMLSRVRAALGPSPRATATWWPLMAAAAAVAVLGTSLVLWQPRVEPSHIQDVSVLQLEKPDIRLPRSTAGVSSEVPTTAPEDELSTALEPYRANDVAEATRRLTALVKNFPGDATAQFYLGVSQLLMASRAPTADFSRRFDQAIAALEAAERLAVDRDVAREASWYLALAYERSGQRQRASDKLRWLCREGGTRANQACAGAGELAETSRVPPQDRTLPPAK